MASTYNGVYRLLLQGSSSLDVLWMVQGRSSIISILGRSTRNDPLLPCIQAILDQGLGRPREHKFRLHALALGMRRAGYTEAEALQRANRLLERLINGMELSEIDRRDAYAEVADIVRRHYQPDASRGFRCSLAGFHEEPEPLCWKLCPRYGSIAHLNLPAMD